MAEKPPLSPYDLEKWAGRQIHMVKNDIIPIITEDYGIKRMSITERDAMRNVKKIYGVERITILPALGSIAHLLQNYPVIKYTKWGRELREIIAAGVAGKLQRIVSHTIYLPPAEKSTKISSKGDTIEIRRSKKDGPEMLPFPEHPAEILIVSEEGTTKYIPGETKKEGIDFLEHIQKFPQHFSVIVPEKDPMGMPTGRLVRLRANPEHPLRHHIPFLKKSRNRSDVCYTKRQALV